MENIDSKLEVEKKDNRFNVKYKEPMDKDTYEDEVRERICEYAEDDMMSYYEDDYLVIEFDVEIDPMHSNKFFEMLVRQIKDGRYICNPYSETAEVEV